MRNFIYRDFGSLVSLGKFSTVGSLMGFLVGKGPIFIEGYFRQAGCIAASTRCTKRALHGTVKTALGTLARGLSRHAEPKVKLH